MPIDQTLVLEILRQSAARTGYPVRNIDIAGRSPVEIAEHVRYIRDERLADVIILDPIQTSAPSAPWVIWGVTAAGRALIARSG